MRTAFHGDGGSRACVVRSAVGEGAPATLGFPSTAVVHQPDSRSSHPDCRRYNETGGLFQDGALERGFLKAENRHRLDFALMWASQTWMNVHPAVGPNVKYGDRAPTFQGNIDRGSFEAMTSHIVSQYFSQPNYHRVATHQGGPKCAFFSIYELTTFVSGQCPPGTLS